MGESKFRHIVCADDLEPELLEILYKQADILKRDFHRRWERNYRATWNRWKKELEDFILITFFYTPSTRTRHTFESAMLRLGGSVISTENAGQFSSEVKGERFRHTIKTESYVGDAIILRLTREGFAQKAADVDALSIINGGDGSGEHPTQALLDLYTILERFGNNRSGLRLTFVGDLLRGRTVKSLARLLANHKGTEFGPVNYINFVGPEELQIPQDVCAYLDQHGIATAGYNQLSQSVLEQSNIVYMTRPQNERPAEENDEADAPPEVEVDGSLYALTPELATHMKEDAIIMHPLPANDELPDEMDDDPRSWYFKQVENGVFTRMALLLWVFDRIDLTSHDLS